MTSEDDVVRHTKDVVLTRPGLSPPTFFAVENGQILVSRALTPLLASLRGKPGLCVPRLASLLTLSTPEDGWLTPYEGVYRIPTHHLVHVWPDGGRTSAMLSRSIAPADGITAEEAIHELRARLTRVIARYAAGKQRIAILVGGGVDSSAVLATTLAWARSASGPEIKAIALHFGGPGDDRPYMRDLVDALGIVPIRLPPSVAGPLVRRMLVLDCAPFPWPNAAFEGAGLVAARNEGADVVWGGAGGDDLYEGETGTLATEARQGHVYDAFRKAVALRTPWREPGLSQAWDFVIRPLLGRYQPAAVRRFRRQRSMRDSLALAGPALRAYLEQRATQPEPSAANTPAARYARFVTLPYLMESSDLSAQLHRELGIERADPLQDDTLIEFVSSLPPALLFHGGRTRGLFRAAMQGLVPDSVRLRRDKAAFEPAMAESVQAAGGFAAFEDLAAVPKLAGLGLVSAKAFRPIFDALARDSEWWGAGWLRVWPALAVEAFLAGLQGAEREAC